MYELFDECLDDSLICKKEIRQVEEQLRETNDYDQTQQLVEVFCLLT